MRRESGVLLGIILLGTFLRFFQLEYKSLWIDEIIQVTLARQGFLETIQGIRTQVAAPPLDYLITWAIIQIGNKDVVPNEFVVRFPAVLWGVLTIAFGYVLARRLTRSGLTALGAAWLIAFAPLLVRFSQEARFYMLSTLLVTALVYFFARGMHSGRLRDWNAFTLLTVLAFFTHYYVGFVLFALLVFAVGLVVVGRHRAHSRTLPPELAGPLRGFVLSLLVFTAFAVPWLLFARPAQEQAQVFKIGSLGAIIREPVMSGHIGAWWHLASVQVLGLAVLPALALLSGLASVRARNEWGLLPWLIVLIGVPGVLFLDWRFSYFYTSRQLLFLVPFYLILVSAGLTAVAQWLAQRSRVAAGAAVAVGLGTLAVVFVLSVRAYYDWPKDDWRSAAQLLNNNGTGNESAILTLPDSLRGYLNYYQPELDVRIRSSTMVNDLVLSEAERLWLVTLGQESPPLLQSLRNEGWRAIRLDPSPSIHVFYLGRASVDELWREAGGMELPPQVVVYSDALANVRKLDPVLAADLARRERAALEMAKPPLLYSQEAIMLRKMRRFD